MPLTSLAPTSVAQQCKFGINFFYFLNSHIYDLILVIINQTPPIQQLTPLQPFEQPVPTSIFLPIVSTQPTITDQTSQAMLISQMQQQQQTLPIASTHLTSVSQTFQPQANVLPPNSGHFPLINPPFFNLMVPNQALPKEVIPDVPYYELPAGLMAPLVKLEDCEYKPINPKDIRLPPPAPPNERLLQAVEMFYAPPSHERPRNSDGWEQLGLYEFFKAKSHIKKLKGLPCSENENSPENTGHNQSNNETKRHSNNEFMTSLKTRPKSPSPSSNKRRYKEDKRYLIENILHLKTKIDNCSPRKSRSKRSRSKSPHSSRRRRSRSDSCSRSRSRSRSRSKSPYSRRRSRSRSRSLSPPHFM